ncbi:hypothetical protein [Nannocystis pusilla]|uniref:hypothetical protein n=1 Tax=Nannocystis pusilla TaxID=889268 RepID=UPI003DA1E06E
MVRNIASTGASTVPNSARASARVVTVDTSAPDWTTRYVDVGMRPAPGGNSELVEVALASALVHALAVFGSLQAAPKLATACEFSTFHCSPLSGCSCDIRSST